MSLFNAQNSALALFCTMHEARIRAMALDTDIVFNIQNNQFTQTSPSSQIEWRPYLGQTLSISNASGTGFTGLGHTKFASTIRINGSDSPGVSLGVGYGKVNLK